jgi:hypothetical protein
VGAAPFGRGRGKTGSRITGLARAGGRIVSAQAEALPPNCAPNQEAGNSSASAARPATRRWKFNRAVILTGHQSQLGDPE